MMVRRPRAPVFCLRALSAAASRASSVNDKLHLVLSQQLLVLLDDGVLRLGKYLHQGLLVQAGRGPR